MAAAPVSGILAKYQKVGLWRGSGSASVNLLGVALPPVNDEAQHANAELATSHP